VFVDLPAVRSGRLAGALDAADVGTQVRAFRGHVLRALVELLPAGVRLVVRRDIEAIARLAEVVRTEADAFPFWSFRLLADTPVCWLEVTGTGRAGELAQAVFGRPETSVSGRDR